MADYKFLQRVQEAGWILRHVDAKAGRIYVSPPGYDLVVKLTPGGPIPQIAEMPSQSGPLRLFDDLRMLWRRRRQELGLTHEDVEHIIGCTPTHYAKFERDTWNSSSVSTRRMPNAQLALDICYGLGLPIYVDRGPLPAPTMRAMCAATDRARLPSLLALGGRMIPSGK